MYFFTASCFPHLHFQLLASQVIAVFSLVCVLLEISYTYMYVCINTHTHTHMYMCAKLLQSCLILCDPMDCSPPGSSVHGILQARILEWVAISHCRGSFLPRTEPMSLLYPGLAHGFFTTSVIWKALCVCVCVCVCIPCHHIYILYN